MNTTNAKTTVKKVEPTSKVSDLRKETEAKKATAIKGDEVKEIKEPVKLIKEQELKPDFIPVMSSNSAEARIQNLENFNILARRFRGLKEKQQELEKFRLANNGMRIKLSLSAEGAESFKVSNTDTLNRVIELIQRDLTERVQATDKEIREFNI